MSDLDIQIKVDPGASLPTLDQAYTKLQQTEKVGQAAGAAMLGLSGSFKSLGQALQQEQAAMTRLNAIHERIAAQSSPLAVGFGRIADQLARERAVLDEIRAPQQQYFDRLMALDTLLDRNAISTKEYVDQVTKLNQASSQVKAPERTEGGGKELLGKVSGAIGGEAGGVLGALAEGGAMGAAIEGVHSLIDAIGEMGAEARRNAEELVQMKDRLTELRNETQKYVDSGHTSARVLEEQAELAHDLHSNLQSTISVYDAVREGADGLNLTHAQQIKLTRTLGEDLLNNNRTLDQAGGLMERLAYAMKAGGLSALDFATLAKQVPGVVKEWEEHFHLSQSALKEAVASGKIGIQQLLDVTVSGGQGIDAEWHKHIRTVGQYRDELKEAYETEIAQSGDNSVVGKYNAIQKALTAAGTEGVDNAQRLKDAYALLGDTFSGVGGVEMKMNLQMMLMNGAFGEHEGHVATLQERFAELGETLASVTEREAMVNATIMNSVTIWKTWVAAQESAKVAADPMIKYLGDYEQKQRNVTEGTKALNALLKEGRISWKYYHEQMLALVPAAQKVADQLGDVRHTLDGLIDAANRIQKPSQTGGMDAQATAQGDYITSIGEGVTAGGDGTYRALTSQEQAAATYRKELGQLLQMQTDIGLSDDQVQQKLGAINAEYMKNIGAVDGAKEHQKELQTMLDAIQKPLVDYQHGVELVNELLRDHAITAAQAAQKLRELKTAYDGTQKAANDAAAGMRRGWDDIVKDATDSAGQIETAMKGAFDSIQQSLEDMVLKGNLDLGSLASSLEQILVKLAVQQVTGGIVSALPHFANGGEGVIGGSGGTDSQLFMAKVTPGEHYSFTPPGQVEARKGGSSSGGGHTTNNYNAFLHDPKALDKQIRTVVNDHIMKNRSGINALLGRG